MGFKFLISSTADEQDFGSKEQREVREEYFIKTKSFKARMIETDQGYIVEKGSEAKKGLSRSCTETYINMRRKLLETEILIAKGDKLVFAEDAVFNSPSAASNMVLGRNSNGFTEWVSSDGRTFKEVQEELNK